MSRPKSATRAQILEAAERVALQMGGRHLTLDAAAQEAGVSKGGVLYHFPTKKALLEGMILQARDTMRARVAARRAAFAGQPNPTLRAFLAAARETILHRIGLRAALVAAVTEDPDLLGPIHDQFQALWAQIRAECADETSAFLIWSAMEGLQFFVMFAVLPFSVTDAAPLFDRLDEMARALPGKDRPDA